MDHKEGLDTWLGWKVTTGWVPVDAVSTSVEALLKERRGSRAGEARQ